MLRDVHPLLPMFFGLDTAFLLHSLIAVSTSSATTAAQQSFRHSHEARTSAWTALAESGVTAAEVPALAVLDLSLPSYLPRLEIHLPDRCTPLRFHCAHGVGSGEVYACRFSNRPGSFQTSLGLYRVGDVYRGDWGRALRLEGLEPGVNCRARERAIVLHAAWYADPSVVHRNIAEGLGPRLGRSQGCPAVAERDLDTVLSVLPAGSFLFVHGPR
jgi:hypothetical protein